MKAIPRLYIACFAFLHVQLALCQKHFLPGYIITHDDDTTYGLIDYRGDARNSKYCVFKSDKTAEPVTYEPADLKAYRFADSKYYISKKLPVRGEQVLVFAEYLVDGIADLYCYRDNLDDHYYIETKNGKLLELTNEEEIIHLEGKGWFAWSTNKHIGLLKSTFADCREIQPDINHAQLTHKSLINIARDYHKYVCEDEECIVYQRQVPFLSFQVGPFIGFNVSKMSFNKHDLYQSFDFRTDYYPAAGISFNMSLPRLNEKMSLQTNVEYGKYSFYASNHFNHSNIIYYDDVHIHSPYLFISAALKYTYPKGMLRPTFNMGVGIQRTMYSELERLREVEYNLIIDTYEYNDVPLAKSIVGGVGGMGFNYHVNEKQILFLNLLFEYLFGNTPYAQTMFKSFNIQAGIYF